MLKRGFTIDRGGYRFRYLRSGRLQAYSGGFDHNRGQFNPELEFEDSIDVALESKAEAEPHIERFLRDEEF